FERVDRTRPATVRHYAAFERRSAAARQPHQPCRGATPMSETNYSAARSRKRRQLADRLMSCLTMVCVAISVIPLVSILGYLIYKGAGAINWDFLTKLPAPVGARSEEHTSELQSRENLVCRLLLDK